MPRAVRIIVLGSGTSAGVPLIGCTCDVCTSDDPRDTRTRSSIALDFIDDTETPRTILFDTSPDLREQALRHQLVRCDAIFFTHNHADHIFGLDEVRRFNVVMDRAIDLYAEPHTLEHLFRVYEYIFQREKNINPSFVATLIPNPVSIGTPIDLFGLRITPIRLMHGRLPIAGYRVESLDGDTNDVAPVQPAPLPLAYCTDVSTIPPESLPMLRDVDTLFLDMLRYRHHPTHLTVDQAIDRATSIDARRTWFIHMTHDIMHAELNPQLPDGMQLSYDGLIVPDDE